MSTAIVPKKYAPKEPPPRAEGQPLDMTLFRPLLEGYYYNIEQHRTMKRHTKKCYLYNIITWARSIVTQHFKLTSDERESWEVESAIWEVVRELEQRRQLFLELTSEANPTLLKIPRNSIGENDD